ncbi:hypothetical protein C7M84_006861 [Penaeus vannamei]|uniref:Uncharacterized protein n=1 Tax=Penaeus vannamei TaxID=6689 RepID=A0A3R7STQ6_PENVA|nr:hypothetical protein C7M84_006861 [Penaeus vannamei]
MDNVIMCDPLGEEDITVEEDPLGYNEELEVKDEPFEFFDDPSCWPSHRGANCNDDDDEEFPGLEILSVDDIAKDDGDDSNHLELIEMIEVGGPDTCSSAADLSLPEEVPSSSSVADTLAEESHSPSQFSTDLDKEKLDALVKREANILKTQERREKEMNQLINLRRRVRRQELKIKQVGGSLLSNLDTGQDPLKDKKLVDVPPLALGADGYGETPKGKRKVGESSSSVGRADAKADSMKDVLQDAEKETELRTQLCTLRDSKEILTYNLWERNSSGTVNSKLRSASEPVAIVAAKFLEELSLLKSHIQRIFCQFDSARSARERALDSWDEVTFHLDCSPLPIYPYPGQENGASEPVTMLTALSGYIWSHSWGMFALGVPRTLPQHR